VHTDPLNLSATVRERCLSVDDACRGVCQEEEVTMVRAAFLKEHRTWEDWVGISVGVLIGLTPWLAEETHNQAVLLNAMAVGLVVLALAAFEFVDLRRWEEVAEFACGSWLIASPFVYDYAGVGQLRFWHFVFGVLVAILAAVEFWQDWKLSTEQLAKHGQ
jgi:hypothetical protein